MTVLVSKREQQPSQPEVDLSSLNKSEKEVSREQSELGRRQAAHPESGDNNIIRTIISSVKDSGEEQITVAEQSVQKQIEEILSEGLDDIYQQLPSDKKAEFRVKGEQTASQITILLRSAKVKMSKMFKLIRSWLQIIPGVNRYFLNQEAKIKADKIWQMEQERRRGR